MVEHDTLANIDANSDEQVIHIPAAAVLYFAQMEQEPCHFNRVARIEQSPARRVVLYTMLCMGLSSSQPHNRHKTPHTETNLLNMC